uniref:Uncharacterized protein n=1 Tax=Acrobeloides nanus TaxID=290746 RepID=A0A914CS97_9BILA
MFVISSPMPTFSGLSAYSPCQSTSDFASFESFHEALDETNSLPPTPKSSLGSLGGLKRTVSSLQAVSTRCSHANFKNNCIVEAKQIEMDFASLTTQSFFIQVHAPNGESSELMNFPIYGATSRFSPKSTGCGHGDWIFEISVKEDNKIVKKNSQKVYLDGVGSLFFTVSDDLQIRLSSQEFLRLPSASQCCSNKRRNA